MAGNESSMIEKPRLVRGFFGYSEYRVDEGNFYPASEGGGVMLMGGSKKRSKSFPMGTPMSTMAGAVRARSASVGTP